MSRPLAILGGTFDPIHNGHLRVAWEAAETLDAELRLIPARLPPHRDAPVADAELRAELLRRALTGQNRLALDLRELRRSGPSYTVDTLAELRAELGPQRPLVLLVGADAFAALNAWHRWREIFELAHIGVLSRPGRSVAALAPELLAEITDRRRSEPLAVHAAPSGSVVTIPVTALDISSSKIRAMLAAGREPRYLLPDALLDDPALLAAYRCGNPQQASGAPA